MINIKDFFKRLLMKKKTVLAAKNFHLKLLIFMTNMGLCTSI